MPRQDTNHLCPSFPACEDSYVYKEGLTHGQRHAYLCRGSARTRVAQEASWSCRPAMPVASDGAPCSDCTVCCCCRGLHCQPHIPGLNACVPARQMDLGRGPAENQPRGKIKTPVPPETLWLSWPRVPPFAGDAAREAWDECSRASLVPFDDGVKSDLCQCT